MKTGRATVSGLAVAAVVLAFFLVPLPVSWVRQVGLVQLQDEAARPVLLRESGRLERLMVTDGQAVEENQELAVFASRDLEFERRKKESDLTIRVEEIRTHREHLARTNDPKERSAIAQKLATKLGEQAGLEEELKSLRERRDRLTLRAPRGGRVISPPRVEDVGKSYDYHQPAPFCLVGDASALRMTVPLRPIDYRLLRQEAMDAGGSLDKLRVTVRVTGRDHHVWEGKLERLPESDAKQVPEGLSHRAGGPIAVKQNPSDPNSLVPQDQHFLATVVILDPDGAISPGTLGQVKIQCRWRSAAWWVWRKANDLFDLGLM